MIKTTVNMDFDTYVKLRDSAKKNKLKLKDIAGILIKLMLTERPLVMPNFQQIRYQERIEGRRWKVFHLLLSESAYETCIDMRKLFKLSVSGVLGVAVELYLERAVEILIRKKDNYAENYFLMKNSTSQLPSYAVFYTLPPIEILNYFIPPPDI